MKKAIKRVLQIAFCGSFSLIIAACYGVMMNFKTYTTKIIAKNGNNKPIPGLQVTLRNDNYELSSKTTDTDGEAYFTIEVPLSEGLNHSVKIEDTDGAENLGDFKTAKVRLDEDRIDYPVTLTEK